MNFSLDMVQDFSQVPCGLQIRKSLTKVLGFNHKTGAFDVVIRNFLGDFEQFRKTNCCPAISKNTPFQRKR